jgi:hypothetical protein
MEWQPIETAPKDGTKILVFTVHGDIELTEWYEIQYPRYVEAENGLYRKVFDEPVTGWNGNTPKYWMPLPDAPVNLLL